MTPETTFGHFLSISFEASILYLSTLIRVAEGVYDSRNVESNDFNLNVFVTKHLRIISY